MNKKFAARTFIGTAISLLCHAASAAEAYPLTYETAIQRALASRIEVVIEQANLAGAAARVSEAKGAFLPSLNVSSGLDRTRLYDDFSPVSVNATFNNTNIPVVISRTASPYQVKAGVQLSYNLYAGGADRARLNESMATQRAAQAQDGLTRKSVVLDVTAAFLELHKAEIAQRKAQRLRDYAQDEVVLAIEQFNRGRLSKIELDVKVLAAETQEMELRNVARSLRDSQRRYMFVLGLDDKIKEPFSLTLQTPLPDVDLEKLFSRVGLTRNHQVVKAQADLEAAQASVAIISAEHKPTLDFFVRYDGIGRSQSGFSDAVSHYGREVMTIGVALKWNLFDGFRTDSRAKQAYASEVKMRLKVDQAIRGITNDRQDKLSREASVRDQLRLTEKQLELSQAQLIIAKKRLETYMVSTMQYRLAQLAVEDAVSKIETLKIDLLMAKAERQLEMFE